jgi:hypothetical protein
VRARYFGPVRKYRGAIDQPKSCQACPGLIDARPLKTKDFTTDELWLFAYSWYVYRKPLLNRGKSVSIEPGQAMPCECRSAPYSRAGLGFSLTIVFLCVLLTIKILAAGLWSYN